MNKFRLEFGLGMLMIFRFIGRPSEKHLKQLLNWLIGLHPNLKFTHQHSRETLVFLDIIVKVHQG